MAPHRTEGRWAGGLARGLGVLVLLLPALAGAQEFSRYLSCSGSVTARGPAAGGGRGGSREAHLDLALRQANSSATIQRSNLLPAGEAMDWLSTPTLYTMTYVLPRQGTQVWVAPGWFANTVLVHYPDLKRLNQVRLAIDRRTGALSGELLNEADELLASTEMRCRALSADERAEPKL